MTYCIDVPAYDPTIPTNNCRFSVNNAKMTGGRTAMTGNSILSHVKYHFLLLNDVVSAVG